MRSGTSEDTNSVAVTGSQAVKDTPLVELEMQRFDKGNGPRDGPYEASVCRLYV